MQEFRCQNSVQRFNDQTKDRHGETVPVVLTVYEDKSFDFVLKTAPVAEMIKKACGIKKVASDSKQTVATLSADKLKEIAEYKMPDLNANDLEAKNENRCWNST